MHTKIIPHMANPLLLTDFLYKALEVGGLMGMLALHGIFTLVTKHGLEYPHFYQRLYSLLVPASLMVRPCSPQHAVQLHSGTCNPLYFSVEPTCMSTRGAEEVMHVDMHLVRVFRLL